MSRAPIPNRILSLLLCALAAAVAVPSVVATPSASAAVKVLKQGAKGKTVKKLQRALKLRADGAWGPQTTRALKRFQRRKGLTATGRLDAQTQQALGWGAAAGGSRLSKGVALTPELIEQVQTTLGVEADGEWGSASAKALKAWETANGLPADGVIDPDVLTRMGIDPAAATPAAPVSSANPNGQALVDAARAQIGVPYRSGGTTPAGFDCSGLTVYVFKQVGIALKRTSFDQFKQGVAVDRAAIQPGDLVFFDTAGAGASHVGVATSPTTVVSATSRGVMEHKIGDSYWGSHYVGARRVS